MKAPVFWLAAFFGFVACVSLACNLPAPSGKSELRSVSVSPRSGRGTFTIMVSYFWRLGDPDYSVSCTLPDIDGKESVLIFPIKQATESTEYDIVVLKPGSYPVTCRDNRSQSVATQFTVVEPPASPEKPEPTVGENKPGSFKIPKPGSFSSAGMWMYFDNGTSNPPDIPVPRQCLPGVNYTHAGGTSSFEIDQAGKIVGACKLSYYNGVTRLTGSMTGAWDGQKDEISFRLETLTEAQAESNGKSGTSSNKTIFEGTARFNSAVQASGTATWQTECNTTNAAVVVCFSQKYPGTVIANGTVPFVINFGP